MSKYTDWGVIHGEGEIVCDCDNCDYEERIEFEGYPDYKEAQQELRSIGWVSKKIDGEWKDFCCQECADEYYQKYRKKRGY